MNNKQYIGRRVSSFEKLNEVGPITGIALVVDEDNEYRAGDQSGYVMEVQCPYGTQAMANDLLASLAGNTYRGFTATDAELDMSAELGDGVTVGGLYSMLANRVLTFGPGHMSDIAAPGDNELEHEYPYISTTQREINRKLAATYSLITKTAEEIRLEVRSEVDSLSSEFTVKLDGITSRVNGLDGDISRIEQYVDSITLSVSSDEGSSTFTLKAGSATLSTQTLELSVDAVNVTGRLTASQIDASDLRVNAANITGSLRVGQLPDDAALLSDIPSDVSDLRNDAGYQTERGVTEIIDGTVTADYVNALGISASYLKGRNIYMLTSGNATSGVLTVNAADTAGYAVDLTSYGALRFTANTGAVYIASAYNDLQLSQSGIRVGDILYPSPDGRQDLGMSNYRWSDVYATNATIQTSDLRVKHGVTYGLEDYDAFYDSLKPMSFLFDDGTSGRRHMGLGAQDVEESLAQCGISTFDFAGFIKSEKLDEDFNPVEGEFNYALRYGEFIPLNIWQIQQLKARVAALEEAVNGKY